MLVSRVLVRSAKPLLLLAPMLIVIALTACDNQMGGQAYMGGGAVTEPPVFFMPTEDDIVTEEASGLRVVKNVLNVTFTPGTTEEKINTIITSIKGEVVGHDKAVNFYQIRLSNVDYESLQKIRMQLLGKYKEVEMASNTPVSAKKNPYYVK